MEPPDAGDAPRGRVSRRAMLSSTALLGASVGVAGPAVAADAQFSGDTSRPAATPPSASQQAAETAPPRPRTRYVGRTGADFMVDVLKTLDIDYIATNPGSSFRGLHESIINHGGNRKPELLTCLHEEIAVAMAHGYYKVSGKPMAALLHGVVGLTHAAMSVYNAWCDRVPVLMLAGNSADAVKRRSSVEWNHSSLDLGATVRDFSKWEDSPRSLGHFGESMTRAYGLAVAQPCGPVLVVADTDLQETEIGSETVPIPAVNRARPPIADAGTLAEFARLLANAEHPVIVADQMARSQAGVDALVALAEVLQAPVIDRMGRMNMPSRHPLNHSDQAREVIAEADVILGLEVWDLWGSLNVIQDIPEPVARRIAPTGAKVLSISLNDLHMRSNHQDFQRYQPFDLSAVADAQASLPFLTEAVRRALPAAGAAGRTARGAALAKSKADTFDRNRDLAALGWDARPVSTARLSMELWDQLKGEDWALVSDTLFKSRWPQRLWDISRYHQFIGSSGGQGQGYGMPAAVGAALAHRDHGRIVVNFQGDGDMLYCPQSLWTAAHHRIPLLTVMHNNRGYNQEAMHVQRMASERSRGVDRASIGTAIRDPDVDFAMMAKSMGVWASSPIDRAGDVAPALRAAIAVVKRGEPALVDVVCQPR